MKRLFLGSLFVFLCSGVSSPQQDTTSTGMYVQYAGVQLNPLIRQIINFNNSSQTIVNPYLVTYSINQKNSGYGFRIGLGLNLNQTTTDDGVTKNEANETDCEIRLGYDKLIRIGHRWELEAGMDLLFNSSNNYSAATTTSNFTEITKQTDENLNYGLGPMVSLRYYLNKHILIGTETSLYYTRGFPKETVSDYEQIPNEPSQYTTTTSRDFYSQATLALPVAFYLVLKF